MGADAVVTEAAMMMRGLAVVVAVRSLVMVAVGPGGQVQGQQQRAKVATDGHAHWAQMAPDSVACNAPQFMVPTCSLASWIERHHKSYV